MESDTSDSFPWPIDVDAEPAEYWVRLKAWSRRHRDCAGHFCRHDERRPCPTPPAVPKFTHCPGASIANPRLWDCGGCEQCSPGHVCHLSGVADFCRGEGHGDEYPVTAWADYELIAMLHIRTALEDE